MRNARDHVENDLSSFWEHVETHDLYDLLETILFSWWSLSDDCSDRHETWSLSDDFGMVSVAIRSLREPLQDHYKIITRPLEHLVLKFSLSEIWFSCESLREKHANMWGYITRKIESKLNQFLRVEWPGTRAGFPDSNPGPEPIFDPGLEPGVETSTETCSRIRRKRFRVMISNMFSYPSQTFSRDDLKHVLISVANVFAWS